MTIAEILLHLFSNAIDPRVLNPAKATICFVTNY